ncbi:hypothetical protein Ddye_022236 [Dipteronia dyeriana]|uniref:Uncharacterized protein n=1 Tax=Dipteronia dyeriana TaxID=168575 RepID=A0AAD9WXM1_9ROSI|nr:hypothetical protein Ddye_022236 [Dipteronia dyeriana]
MAHTMAQSHETVPNITITLAQSHENISPEITESHDAAGIVGSVFEINKSHVVMTTSFEEMIEQNLQGFGWAMFFQVILIALSAFFYSEQAFISIYTDGIPTCHCINNASKHATPSTLQIFVSFLPLNGPGMKSLQRESFQNGDSNVPMHSS